MFVDYAAKKKRSDCVGRLAKILPMFRPLPSPRRGSGAPRNTIPQGLRFVALRTTLMRLGALGFDERLASHLYALNEEAASIIF